MSLRSTGRTLYSPAVTLNRKGPTTRCLPPEKKTEHLQPTRSNTRLQRKRHHMNSPWGAPQTCTRICGILGGTPDTRRRTHRRRKTRQNYFAVVVPRQTPDSSPKE
ncbi:hypothetical protein, unlikely [Trypanosoma brucei gambiense DAL972]|uniref:Uncharacterized protein n=1 Tax=Trypanosoma brucei gambiense (strain MHOM/CI/86/DAL972) TaxID=679716 RepID=D0A0E1_TRYB9|nr:hypothetical protein, unlikely [Trypanosoma brucei gambiense DAL972]CBH16699.1 hypothetical protein, unlikely [Trypanosoma brucei gambiense DAL972]|eukprot:XP_011778963.1 hypothetical protein, unlikely [Trypanosoma brucei gambiense DAL972]